MSAFDTQVGGNHYKDMAIQPVEFIQKNRLGFIEGNIVKYICRWRGKNGIDDLRKVRHYIDLLIEMETAIQPARHEEPELTYAEHQAATDPAIKYARDMADLRELATEVIADYVRPTTRERAAARHLAEMSPSAQKGIEGCEACE